MIDRIKKLTEKTIKGEMWIEHTDTEYDREDIFLSPLTMNAKRTYEYILNQKPFINECTAFTGFLGFRGNVMGDNFTRCGHVNYKEMDRLFYNQPIDSLVTWEFQHSVADFEKVIRIGINGFREEIQEAMKTHKDAERLEFLSALELMTKAMEGWAEKCHTEAKKQADEAKNEETANMLYKLANALKKVPMNPAETFYEAILSLYFTYAFVPDSIGCIDRYLYPFYKKEIEAGTLTEEEAKAYLQELFLMLQARIHISSDRFTRGGESHFCIGGYLENGEDSFNELSKLIVDSLMELPTWIPQISLRWTKKTPSDVLKYMMDCERKDPNKRIAFVNDESRIKALMEFGDFPFELACKYTMVGCNEPQLPGGIFLGGCDTNGLKPVEHTFFNRTEAITNAKSFDEFYAIFEEELFKVMDKILEYYNNFQSVRARDKNYVGSMFYEGAIERAKSITEGGSKNAIASIQIFGISNVIDSLTVVKQFVYDNKTISMGELVSALSANWNEYENLRNIILKKAEFFGNDTDISNEIADRYADSLKKYLKDIKSDLGHKFMIGNLIGYNQHNKWFGAGTKATPDGRFDGDSMNFGIGQSEGKDREGISALLNSVAKLNSHTILCGSTVTNVLIDEQLIINDDNFEKTVKLFETYLRCGGLHFQLTYVSKEDLKAAKVSPDEYKNLRVRVSGFSDYFVRLNEDLQDEIIERTEKVC